MTIEADLGTERVVLRDWFRESGTERGGTERVIHLYNKTVTICLLDPLT